MSPAPLGQRRRRPSSLDSLPTSVRAFSNRSQNLRSSRSASRVSEVGQRTGVHREARAAVVGARGHRDALSASGIDGGPLFRSLRKDGTVGGRLPAGQVARIYKAMAGRAGFSAQMVRRISGHSPRVGAAQDMIASGIGTPAIMQAGRWKSAAMVQRYGERLLAKRNGAAQLARLQKRR